MLDEDEWGSFSVPETTSETLQTDHSIINLVYEKGQSVLYHDRSGNWLPCKILSVDQTIDPPSYCIEINGGLRETEAFKLKPLEEVIHPNSSVIVEAAAAVGASAEAVVALGFEEDEDDGFGDFEAAPPFSPSQALKPIEMEDKSPKISASTAVVAANNTISGAANGSLPGSSQSTPHKPAIPLPADLFAEGCFPLEEEEEVRITSLDTTTVSNTTSTPSVLSNGNGLHPLPFGSVIALTELATKSEQATSGAVAALGRKPMPASIANGNGNDTEEEEEDDDDFGDFEAAAPAANATTNSVAVDDMLRFGGNGVATLDASPIENAQRRSQQATPLAIATEEKEEGFSLTFTSSVQIDTISVVNGVATYSNGEAGGIENAANDDDFGDFTGYDNESLTTISEQPSTPAPSIKEAAALILDESQNEKDPVMEALSSVSSKATSPVKAIPGTALTAAGGVGGATSGEYDDYPVVWTRLLKAAAQALTHGKSLWTQACSHPENASLTSSSQVSTVDKLLLEHPTSQIYFAALGRVFFAASIVKLAAQQFGLLGFVEELREAWEECHTAWESDINTINSINKEAFTATTHTLNTTITNIVANTNGENESDGESLCFSQAVHAASAAVGKPLDVLLNTLTTAEEDLKSLTSDEFPRMLVWSEGLDGITLLPLSVFTSSTTGNDALYDAKEEGLGVKLWMKDNKPCLVPVAKLWIECVSTQPPVLE